MTLIISSHILSELYAVANRFLFIEQGRVLKEVTKQELDLECSRCVVVKADNTKKTATLLEDIGIRDYKVIDSTELRIYDQGARPEVIARALVQNDVALMGLSESGVSLEDYFKQLVGEVSR